MPVRDGARYLGGALSSLLRTGHPTFELIVVDDGSTDDSVVIAKAACRRHPNLILLQQPAQGVAAALEHGRCHARAKLIARMDADDLAAPERLARQMAAFEADAELVLLGTAVDKINERGRTVGRSVYPTGHDNLVRELAVRNPFIHSTVMMRAATVESVGGYRQFFEAAEDYDLWLRLAERGRIANLRERLGAHRSHVNSVTRRAAVRQAFSAALARRCAAARRRGDPDPADGMEQPLDLYVGAAAPVAFACDARLFQTLAFADEATFTIRSPTRDDINLLLQGQLPTVEAKLAHAALSNVLRRDAVPAGIKRRDVFMALVRRGPLWTVKEAVGWVLTP